MELLETQDPEKRKLIETSERHKRALKKEVNQITERTEKMLTNALIITGSLIVTYFLVSSISRSKPRRKKKKIKPLAVVDDDVESGEAEEDEVSPLMAYAPSLISQLGNKVVNQATLILLDIAREKLKDYLHPRKKDDENS